MTASFARRGGCRDAHRGSVIAVLAATLCIGPWAALAQTPSPVDTEGTLYIDQLRIPASELWSPEFKEFYTRTTRSAVQSGFPGIPVPPRKASRAEWDEFAASMNRTYLAAPLSWALRHYSVTVEETTIGGVRVGVVSPKEGPDPQNRHRVLINLHGGSFVYYRGLSFGELESIPVASLGRIKVVTVDYRQAPFHSYPAASEDVGKVYGKLLRDYEPGAIGIFGCSAGGALTAQTVAWLQAKRLPRPGAIVISCYGLPNRPDRWKNGDSTIWATGIPKTFSTEDKKAVTPAQWYWEGADREDPVAYPGSSDAVLGKFPPTLLLNGTRDVTLSAAIAANARLAKLGVESSLYLIEGGTHAAHVMAVNTPEARDASAYIAQWFGKHLE